MIWFLSGIFVGMVGMAVGLVGLVFWYGTKDGLRL